MSLPDSKPPISDNQKMILHGLAATAFGIPSFIMFILPSPSLNTVIGIFSGLMALIFVPGAPIAYGYAFYKISRDDEIGNSVLKMFIFLITNAIFVGFFLNAYLNSTHANAHRYLGVLILPLIVACGILVLSVLLLIAKNIVVATNQRRMVSSVDESDEGAAPSDSKMSQRPLMNVALLLFFLIAFMIKETRLMAVFCGAIVACVALGRVFIMELKRIFSTSTSAQRRHGRVLFPESDEIAPTEEEKVLVLSDERRPNLEDKFNKGKSRDPAIDGTLPEDDATTEAIPATIDDRESGTVSRNVGRILIDALKISTIGALLAVCLLTYWTEEAYRIYPWEISNVRHWQGFIFTPAYLLLGVSLIGAIIGFVAGLCIRISGPLAMVIIFILFTLWSFMPAAPTRNLSNYNFRLSNPDEGERIDIFPSEDSLHGSAPDTAEAVAIVDSLMTPREHYREIDWREEEWRRDRMNDYLSAARLGMAWVGDSQAVAMHFASYPDEDGGTPTNVFSHAISSSQAIFLILHYELKDDSVDAIECRIELKRIGAGWNLVWMGERYSCQPGRGAGEGWQKTFCY